MKSSYIFRKNIDFIPDEADEGGDITVRGIKNTIYFLTA